MKTITLNQVGYLVQGETTLNLWGGGQGTIEMKPTVIEELTLANVIEAINDNGFGCESFAEASVDVAILYERGVKEYFTSVDFEEEDLTGCTRANCDYKKLADDYESKYGKVLQGAS